MLSSVLSLLVSATFLSLAPTSTDTEIKNQFRKLAVHLHPDVNPDAGSKARFAQVTEAQEVLLSKTKRIEWTVIRSRKTGAHSGMDNPNNARA